VSGQIWGNAVANVGDIASGAFRDYSAQKQEQKQAAEISKRDAAMFGEIEAAEKAGKVPEPSSFLKRYGPPGEKMYSAYMAMKKASEQPGTDAQAVLPDIFSGYKNLSPGGREVLYNGRLRDLAQKSGWVGNQPLPEKWSHELDAQIMTWAESFGTKPKEQPPQKIEVRNSDGSTSIRFVTPKPGEVFTSAAEPKDPKNKVLMMRGGKPTWIEPGTQQEGDIPYNEHNAPDKPSYDPKPIIVNGKEVMANYNSRTGKYHDPDTGQVLTGIQGPPTADMRNKASGRKLVKKSVDSIKAISENILTRVGPAQRAQAIKRGAEAVFGTDPAFRTYQDARTALAGNLAVAQQGSRPSDADIKRVWLPLVPDPYSDTKESAEMKWKLIEEMSNIDEPKEEPRVPDGTKPGPGAKDKKAEDIFAKYDRKNP
jgi:hypothetical protein